MTADTYTSVLPGAQREVAEATARLVLDAGKPGEEIRRQISGGRESPREPVVLLRQEAAGGRQPRWRRVQGASIGSPQARSGRQVQLMVVGS
jgi:hypothetical protein